MPEKVYMQFDNSCRWPAIFFSLIKPIFFGKFWRNFTENWQNEKPWMDWLPSIFNTVSNSFFFLQEIPTRVLFQWKFMKKVHMIIICPMYFFFHLTPEYFFGFWSETWHFSWPYIETMNPLWNFEIQEYSNWVQTIYFTINYTPNSYQSLTVSVIKGGIGVRFPIAWFILYGCSRMK